MVAVRQELLVVMLIRIDKWVRMLESEHILYHLYYFHRHM